MAWMSLRKQFNHLLKQGLLNISCCDLCGADVGIVVLANKVLEQSLLCQHCVDDLPFFNLNLLQANLLSWPAIYKALPNIHFDCLSLFNALYQPFRSLVKAI